MKLTVQHVMDATLVISQIIRDAVPMPQKGKYRLARMHTKLLPEFKIIDAQRDAMIKAYDTPELQITTNEDGSNTTVETGNYMVPEGKMPEFIEAWKVIADQEIEVDIEPIPFAQIDLGDHENGSIEASQLITLGVLVAE